jgi:hypothetical protein
MADEQNFKIVITSTADTTGFKDTTKAVDDLSKSVPESWQQMEKLGGKTKDAAGEGEKFSMKGREMKQVLNQLDNAVPGLGKAIEGLGDVITGTGGSMIVLQLAIKATQVYWDLYQESVAAAEKKTAEKFDSMRSTARSALQELEAYQKKLAEVSKSEDPAAEKLAADRAVMAAEFKGRRQVLQSSQEAEMALAQTPEQREAVKRKFSALSGRMDAEQSTADLNLVKATIDALAKERDAATAERAKLENERQSLVETRGEAMRFGLRTDHLDPRIRELTAGMEAQGAIATRAQGRITRYSSEAAQGERVFNANAGNARMMEVLNSTGGQSNQTLAQVASTLGLSERQKVEIMQRILNGTMTSQQVWAGFNVRLAQMQAQLNAMQRTGSR